MPVCDKCGNEYDKTFELRMNGRTFTFDSFECAIEMTAPRCAHCDCRVIGHGIEAGDRFIAVLIARATWAWAARAIGWLSNQRQLAYCCNSSVASAPDILASAASAPHQLRVFGKEASARVAGDANRGCQVFVVFIAALDFECARADLTQHAKHQIAVRCAIAGFTVEALRFERPVLRFVERNREHRGQEIILVRHTVEA